MNSCKTSATHINDCTYIANENSNHYCVFPFHPDFILLDGDAKVSDWKYLNVFIFCYSTLSDGAPNASFLRKPHIASRRDV